MGVRVLRPAGLICAKIEDHHARRGLIVLVDGVHELLPLGDRGLTATRDVVTTRFGRGVRVRQERRQLRAVHGSDTSSTCTTGLRAIRHVHALARRREATRRRLTRSRRGPDRTA